MKQCHQIEPPEVKYHVRHPLLKMNCHFDCWWDLCEYVVYVAEEEAKKRMYQQLADLIKEISSEIIDSVEEIPLDGA